MTQYIVLRDVIEKNFEPYDRKYLLGEMAGMCDRIPFLKNSGLCSLQGMGYKDGEWERHEKVMTYVCLEINEITGGEWTFTQEAIGEWAVKLELLQIHPEDVSVFPT